VRIRLVPTPQSTAFVAQAMPLVVVHEDADVLVIDKPAGLVVHPAAGHWSGTLLNGLLAHHPDAARLPRAGIVHRLDKDTSGLMVVARTPAAAFALSQAIAARSVRREYLALVHGHLSKATLQIDAPIGRDPVSRVRMAVVAGARAARTDVTVLAEGKGDAHAISAVHCRLHTGRTHQIRVHLASRGHPLVGDALYGGAPALGLQRQALHAARLGFVHPRTSEDLQFEAPLPADLSSAWRQVAGGPPIFRDRAA
jgi:23S rRNA pseudouridine1911/1915/1917 synthase